MSELPTFETFYRQLHGRDPFPWQIALADRVVGEGWPELLDLPTGTGKTSALDVALYALAARPDVTPRRIVLVVDRRIVVDQGAEHARSIRKKLISSESRAVRAVADALRALTGAEAHAAPFAVAVLRGGAPRDDDWAKRPDIPVLGVSTVDQVGSRLLFRGYGVSPKLASIHAGLMGNDTLILLDEVHLAIPFAQTLRALRDRYNRSQAGLPSRFNVVEMSATPTGPRPTSVVGLSERDQQHPVIRQRLQAEKPARLVQHAVSGAEANRRAQIAHAVADEALKLRRAGAKTVGVVVNRVDTARLAAERIRAHAGVGSVVLVTGRMRPLDRDRVVETELVHADASRDRGAAEPVVVVATQCIEAGADLDFDAMVTELASFDALKQRFGRLDRRGEVTRANGHAPAVIVARADVLGDKANDPVYGASLPATWAFLQGRANAGVVDMGVSALAVDPPAPEVAEGLVVKPKSAPVLMPGHVDAWAQTSPLLRPEPDPDVALWLHGPDRESAEVQVVWRADLLDEDLARWGEDAERMDGIQEVLALVRPSSLEALPLPVHVARAWLRDLEVPPIADVASEAEGEEGERHRAAEGWVALAKRDEAWVPVRASDMRPGDILILPASRGGLRTGSFDPESKDPVPDLGDLAQLRGRGILSLRTHGSTLAWLDAPTPPAPDDARTGREDRDALQEWLATLPADVPVASGVRAHEWRHLRGARLRRNPTVVCGPSADGRRVEQFVVSERLPLPPDLEVDAGEAYSDDDRSSFTAADRSLRQHSFDVRDKALEFTRTLRLPEQIAADVVLAAWLHDVGKVDPRFQMLLAGGDEVRLATLEEPQAKSRLPNMSATKWMRVAERAQLPTGYRHELSSLAMIEGSAEVQARATDFDLVLHLVASHHGWCRPFAPAVPLSTDGAAPELAFALEDRAAVSLNGSAEHRYASLDGGVADRFWRVHERYGPWGLAWLEAILRLADHRASEEVEMKGGDR